MTHAQEHAAPAERDGRLDAVARRSLEIGREHAMIAEVVGRLREDARRLQVDVSALEADRKQREGDLADARARVASLDTFLQLRQLGLRTKERELVTTRNELEHKMDLARQVEQEVLGCRKQIAAAQARLADLVEHAVRIQHKLWLVTNRDPRGGSR